MKRFITIILVILLMTAYTPVALAGQWLNVDATNSKVWVDTSHLENQRYQAWVDTSHNEWRSWNVWVSSGYYSSQYFDTGFSSFTSQTDKDWLTPSWDFWSDNVVDDAWNTWEERAHNWAYWVYSGGNKWNMWYYTQYYGPYYNGDGTYRQLKRDWQIYIKSQNIWGNLSQEYRLWGESYYYWTRTYGWRTVWVDTSHWETRWGWVWVSSGYWGWFDNWVWVTSGYWDEAHGTITLNKWPNYVFTAWHTDANGNPRYMEANITWNLDHDVKSVSSYHQIIRIENRGTEWPGPKWITYGQTMPTKQGTAKIHYEYNRAGIPDSTLYITLEMTNGTKATVYAKIPVNGTYSTNDVTTPTPVFDKSLLNNETINF